MLFDRGVLLVDLGALLADFGGLLVDLGGLLVDLGGLLVDLGGLLVALPGDLPVALPVDLVTAFGLLLSPVEPLPFEACPALPLFGVFAGASNSNDSGDFDRFLGVLRV